MPWIVALYGTTKATECQSIDSLLIHLVLSGTTNAMDCGIA